VNKYNTKYYYLRCYNYQSVTINLSQKQKKKEQNLKSKEKFGQVVSCQAYYSFIEVNTKNEESQNEIMLEASKSVQVHNHPPIALKKLTLQMEEDVKLFSKNSKIVEIQRFLEAKYSQTKEGVSQIYK